VQDEGDEAENQVIYQGNGGTIRSRPCYGRVLLDARADGETFGAVADGEGEKQ